MMAWGFAGTLAALLSGQARVAVGFALGAALAVLNYFWLHQAIESLFSAHHARIPRLVVMKIVVRSPLAFAGIYLFYRTGWLPFAAIVAGLFVPVAGILVEALYQIYGGLGKTLTTDN